MYTDQPKALQQFSSSIPHTQLTCVGLPASGRQSVAGSYPLFPHLYHPISLCSHLSMFSHVCVPICLCSHISVFPFVYVLTCLRFHLSVFPFVCVLISLCSHLSMFSHVCAFTYLCSHLSVFSYHRAVCVCLLVGCLTSQQQASVSQGRICSDNFTCCHTEIEVADPTVYRTQSQYTDTGPTSPSADPITPGAWQGSHWSANFEVTGMTRPRKKSRRKRDSNPGPSALEADALTTRPTRR